MQGVEYFHKGGLVMYILLICSIFIITIGVERLLYFMKADSGRAFAQNFYKLMINNKIEEARNLAQNSKGDLAFLVDFAFNKMQNKNINLMMLLEVQSGISISKFRERLYYLNVIVTMAPLLGLIATATGLCVAIVSLSIHAYFVQRIDRIVTDMEQVFSLIEGYITRGE